MVEAGAFEFAETEAFLAAGEAIAGPYVWGRYDLLLLPPSFPYGAPRKVFHSFSRRPRPIAQEALSFFEHASIRFRDLVGAGGMENPCLTFVTPTLLAGDRSLANVVAHEIAHSWTVRA